MGSTVPSRVSQLIILRTQAECLLTGFLPISAAASIYLFKLPYAIGSIRSSSGHALACRWRSLPRVRRHRASSLQSSSSTGCCLCITIVDHFLCASLFPHGLLVWSERMSKVSEAVRCNVEVIVYTAALHAELFPYHSFLLCVPEKNGGYKYND